MKSGITGFLIVGLVVIGWVVVDKYFGVSSSVVKMIPGAKAS